MLLFHDLQSIFLETESREWFGDYGASGDVSRFGIVWFPDWLQSRVGRGTSFPISTLALKKPCWTDLYASHLRHQKYVNHFWSFTPDRSVTGQWQWPCDALHYEDWHFPEAGFLKKKSPCPRLLHPVTSLTTCCDDMKIDIFQQNLGSHVGLLTHLMIEISTKLYVVRMHNAQCTMHITDSSLAEV